MREPTFVTSCNSFSRCCSVESTLLSKTRSCYVRPLIKSTETESFKPYQAGEKESTHDNDLIVAQSYSR